MICGQKEPCHSRPANKPLRTIIHTPLCFLICWPHTNNCWRSSRPCRRWLSHWKEGNLVPKNRSLGWGTSLSPLLTFTELLEKTKIAYFVKSLRFRVVFTAFSQPWRFKSDFIGGWYALAQMLLAVWFSYSLCILSHFIPNVCVLSREGSSLLKVNLNVGNNQMTLDTKFCNKD